MKVSNGVEMLELEVEAFGGRTAMNPTLVWDDQAAILIDAGMPGTFQQIRAAISKAGVPFDKLKAVILTHQDLDHIGTMPEIVKESNGGIEVYAHELDQPYIEGTLPLIKTEPSKMAKALEFLPEDDRRKFLQLCENPPKTKVHRTLADGEELPYCGGIQVIYTPGHTRGHISLYLKRSKTLVAADALICVGGKLRGPVAQTTLDMNEALRSVGKFLQYDIESVICYHGGLSNVDVTEQLRAIVEDSRQK